MRMQALRIIHHGRKMLAPYFSDPVFQIPAGDICMENGAKKWGLINFIC